MEDICKASVYIHNTVCLHVIIIAQGIIEKKDFFLPGGIQILGFGAGI
jgi:hypothetical protein